mmetsp:Transcript_33857/g.65896  ORF Transcript_33857/g.65896 Transcript_33857/m.65896 type:complete len:780 (+) Transcript_33857:29-2368(+)
MPTQEPKESDDPFALYEEAEEDEAAGGGAAVEGKAAAEDKGADEDEDEDAEDDDDDLFRDTLTAMFQLDTTLDPNGLEKKARSRWLEAVIGEVAESLKLPKDDVEFEDWRLVSKPGEEEEEEGDDEDEGEGGDDAPPEKQSKKKSTKKTDDGKTKKAKGKQAKEKDDGDSSARFNTIMLFLKLTCSDAEALIAKLKALEPVEYGKDTDLYTKIRCRGMKEPTRSKCDCSCGGSYSVIGLVLFLVALIFLKSNQEFLRPAGMSNDGPPAEDYYKLLNIPSTASKSKIRSAYRKLAMKYHPDKNPNCAECEGLMHRISEAYAVLSDEKRKKMYDALEINFKPLPSDAEELTAENFDTLVRGSEPGTLWVVQVYAEWHKASIGFANAWENVVQSLDPSGAGVGVRFGRIHMKEQEALCKSLSVAIRVLPTVLSFRDGQLLRVATFGRDTQTDSMLLRDFIDTQLEDRSGHLDLATAAAFIQGPPAGSVLVVRKAKKENTARIVKHLAAHFDGMLGIYQLELASSRERKSLLAALQQQGVTKKSKLPMLIWRSSRDGTLSVAEKVAPRDMKAVIYTDVVAQASSKPSATKLTPTVYNNWCVERDGGASGACLLRLEGCSSVQQPPAEFDGMVDAFINHDSGKVLSASLDCGSFQEFTAVQTLLQGCPENEYTHLVTHGEMVQFVPKGTSASAIQQMLLGGGDDDMPPSSCSFPQSPLAYTPAGQSDLMSFENIATITTVGFVILTPMMLGLETKAMMRYMAMGLFAASVLGGFLNMKMFQGAW